MEIHGVVGGYTGPGIKTVIPPRATVKVSCRLVPKQDPLEIVDLIRDTCREESVSLIIVTHSMEVAGQFERVDRLEEINRIMTNAELQLSKE